MSIVAAPPVAGGVPGGEESFVGVDGRVLPPDPLAGIEVPDDDGEVPVWVDQPVSGAWVASGGGMPVTLPEPVSGPSVDVTQAVFEWELGAALRRGAEAAEAVSLLAAEAAFRDRFCAEFGDDAWFDGGGYKCFTADAALIGKSGPRTAAHRLETVRRAHDHLHSVWDLFLRGEVTLVQVSAVVRESDGLDDETLAAYDVACAAALTTQLGSRLYRKVAEIRERVQARTADERHERARAGRSARLEPGRDGMGRLVLEGPVEGLAAADQAATKAAVAARGHAGETRSVGALKFDLLTDLILDGFATAAAVVRDGLLAASPDAPQRAQAVPQRRQVVPTVVVHVPVLTLLGHSDEPASIDGIGPISPAQAKRLCADAPSFYRVLTHPVTGARMTLDRTTYSPPADLRRWIQIRDEYSRFPGCLTPAHLCDIDHVQEWHDAGVTNQDNLVALSRDKHILKSMGLYTVSGDPNGELTFTSPIGMKHTSTPREPAHPVSRRIRNLIGDRVLPDECPF